MSEKSGGKAMLAAFLRRLVDVHYVIVYECVQCARYANGLVEVSLVLKYCIVNWLLSVVLSRCTVTIVSLN